MNLGETSANVTADWYNADGSHALTQNAVVLPEVRGEHPEYVFTHKGHQVNNINNSSWKRVRKEVGLPLVREHDLKYTFGRRLRAAGCR